MPLESCPKCNTLLDDRERSDCPQCGHDFGLPLYVHDDVYQSCDGEEGLDDSDRADDAKPVNQFHERLHSLEEDLQPHVRCLRAELEVIAPVAKKDKSRTAIVGWLITLVMIGLTVLAVKWLGCWTIVFGAAILWSALHMTFEDMSPAARKTALLQRKLRECEWKVERLAALRRGDASQPELVGARYEAAIGDLFEGIGYSVEYRGLTLKYDGGVDLVCFRGDETVFVQCKCWSQSSLIRVEDLRDIMASFARFRTSGYTRSMSADSDRSSESDGSVPCNSTQDVFCLTSTDPLRVLTKGKPKTRLILVAGTVLTQRARELARERGIAYIDDLSLLQAMRCAPDAFATMCREASLRGI